MKKILLVNRWCISKSIFNIVNISLYFCLETKVTKVQDGERFARKITDLFAKSQKLATLKQSAIFYAYKSYFSASPLDVVIIRLQKNQIFLF